MGQTPTFDGTKIKNKIHIAAIFFDNFLHKFSEVGGESPHMLRFRGLCPYEISLEIRGVEQVFSSYFSEVLKGFLPTIPDFLLSFVL